MIRLVSYIIISLGITLAISWLIGLNGNLVIDFAGYRAQPSIGVAILLVFATIFISIAIWTIISKIITAPKKLTKLAQQSKKEKGIKALSEGFIALQAGDGERARKLAKQAIEKLPNVSGAKLLEAQSDLMVQDMASAREHYKALINNPDTSLAALHGLFQQANAQQREDVALTFASKAYQLSNKSDWAQKALFKGLTKEKQWQKALAIIVKQQPKDKKSRLKNNRQQALLHSAIAQELEASDPDSALHNVKLALKLLPNFVPAALIGAQIYINRNELRKSSSLLRRVFNATKHPQIAQLYIHAQSGASAIDRLKRAKELIGEISENAQVALVLAKAAIDAYEWSLARKILSPFINEPTQAICMAMAQIEEGQNNDQGKVRNWLAKAVNAPRDALWVGDGVVSDVWQATSPLSGKFDVFEWKSPPSAVAVSQKDDFQDDGFKETIIADSEKSLEQENKILSDKTID